VANQQAAPAGFPESARVDRFQPRRTVMSDASDVSDVAATATNKGDISVIITGADGKRVQAEISVQLAEKLKGQIEAALVTARIRANRR
jgi:hypothetical protein